SCLSRQFCQTPAVGSRQLKSAQHLSCCGFVVAIAPGVSATSTPSDPHQLPQDWHHGGRPSRCRLPGGQMKSRVFALALFFLAGSFIPVYAADIVLYSSDVTTVHGNWSRVQDGSGAGGQIMASADNGWAQTDYPLSGPND